MVSNPVIRGASLMAASSIVFCVMGALIKFIPGVDISRTTLMRFVVGIAVLGTAAMSGRIRLDFVNSPLLFLRGLVGGTAVFVAFWSISRLGIAKSTILTYTYPVFSALISVFVLRERLSVFKGLCIVAAMAGMALIAAPGAGSPSEPFAVAVALGGAVLSGLAVVLVKMLHRTDSSYSIFFAQSLVGFWLIVVPANASHGDISAQAVGVMILIGAAAAGGQLLMTEAYHYVSATMGSLLSLMTPVGSLFVGVLVFKESLGFAGFLGAALIVLSCMAMIAADAKS